MQAKFLISSLINFKLNFQIFEKVIENTCIIIFLILFSLVSSTITFGIFYFNKYLIFIDITIFVFLIYIFYSKNLFPKKENAIYIFLIILYIFFILLLSLSVSESFPKSLSDFTRYHLKLPLIWIDLKKFPGDLMILEQLLNWGVQHIVYAKLFMIFTNLKISVIYNFTILYILFPLSIYLLFTLISNKYKTISLLISFLPLTSGYIYASAYSGDNSLNVFIFFINFIIFFEKFIKTNKKIYLFVSLVSLMCLVMEKLTGIFFIPTVVMYILFRFKNIFIIFLIFFATTIGSFKYIHNYFYYKNFFYPLIMEIPLVSQKEFAEELYLHHSCKNTNNIKSLNRFCYLSNRSKDKTNKLNKFKESSYYLIKIILNIDTNQKLKKIDPIYFYYSILYLIPIIILFLLIKWLKILRRSI